MKRHHDAAERIINVEGFAFALASLTGKELDTARAMLKDSIIRELRNAFDHGADMQRRAIEGNALIDELEAMVQR